MTEPEDLEEDLFADLYDADDSASKPQPAAIEPAPGSATAPAPVQNVEDINAIKSEGPSEIKQEDYTNGSYGNVQDNDSAMNWSNGQNDGSYNNNNNYGDGPPESHGIGIKEDGKMFIGGLNWETTDQSLKDYFSKFGEVQECTVMRDGASGRSRGFGFLTFKDPRTVNVVMVKEHFLDGKIVRPSTSTSVNAPGRRFPRPSLKDPNREREHGLTLSKIDPKRAIPRDEQERTSKIFVGGVSQEANEQDFKEYFSQFGRVVDATLMIDKETHRPRGFGFVTFDNEAAVEATLQGDLMIKDKPIEVKKAQPRGNMREEEEFSGRRGGRRGGGGRDLNDRGNFDNNANNANQNQGPFNQQTAGMTPQMMAQYWTKMQQYFATMQQQMAAMQGGGMGMPGGMNPAMMAQMQQMQQMRAMQQQMAAGGQHGSQSPMPQSPGAQGGMQGMNPMMMQQMQQMQQMAQQGGGYGMNPGFGGQDGGQPTAPPGGRGTPGFNAQDQLLFEQQKYEQQQARRAAQEAQQMQGYTQGGPTSWEGMYDDVPQPNMGGHGGGGGGGRGGRGGGFQKHTPTPGPQSAPPANAPTGPKNAGKPGANYRGGAGGRGGHRGGYHPYAR